MMIFYLRVFLSLENCVFIEVMDFHLRDQISLNWGGKIKLITFVYRSQITKVINLRSWWWIFWSQWHIFIFYHNDIFHFTNFYRIFSKVRTFHKSHGISSKCWLFIQVFSFHERTLFIKVMNFTQSDQFSLNGGIFIKVMTFFYKSNTLSSKW